MLYEGCHADTMMKYIRLQNLYMYFAPLQNDDTIEKSLWRDRHVG